jgi:hypothetical protein
MTVGYREGKDGQWFILGDSGITDTYGHPVWIEQVGGTVTVGNSTPMAVKLSGAAGTLLASTAIAATGTVAATAVTGLDIYSRCGFQLTQSAKSIAAGTISLYVQRSLDAGLNWDDIASFASITAGTVAGTAITYSGVVLGSTNLTERAQLDGAMTAANIGTVLVWGDRLRAKYIALSMGTADTVTAKLTAYFVP